MVRSTLRPRFTPRKDTVSISQEAGWASGPVWTGEKTRPHRVSIPDRPARSSVAILIELPGPHFKILKQYYDKNTVAELDTYENILVFTHTLFATLSINVLNKAL